MKSEDLIQVLLYNAPVKLIDLIISVFKIETFITHRCIFPVFIYLNFNNDPVSDNPK